MQAVDARRKVDRSSPVPLHFQIRALLIESIEQGEVVQGVPLPPEKELANRYGVSLSPIRQAILDLVKEGVLYRRAGRGTFLRAAPQTERVTVLGSFSQSLRDSGRDVHVVMLAQDIVKTPKRVADLVGPEIDEVVIVERLTVIDGEPAAVLRSSLPADRFAGVASATLPNDSLYRHLDELGVIPMRAETTVDVIPCSTAWSAHLRVAAGSPLLHALGAVYDADDAVIEAFDVQYRPDIVRLRFDTLSAAEDVVEGSARAP